MLFDLFKSRKKDSNGAGVDHFGNKSISSADAGMNKIFRIGAILVVGYILYSTYQAEKRPVEEAETKNKSNGEASLTEEQIQRKVQEAFTKLKNSPEFKKVSDFVSMIEKNSHESGPSIIESTNGYIIYVPYSKIEDKSNFDLSSSKHHLSVSVDNLPQDSTKKSLQADKK